MHEAPETIDVAFEPVGALLADLGSDEALRSNHEVYLLLRTAGQTNSRPEVADVHFRILGEVGQEDVLNLKIAVYDQLPV